MSNLTSPSTEFWEVQCSHLRRPLRRLDQEVKRGENWTMVAAFNLPQNLARHQSGSDVERGKDVVDTSPIVGRSATFLSVPAGEGLPSIRVQVPEGV